jgi:hypothetical protein
MRRFISNVHIGYNVVEEVKDLVSLDPIYMLPEVKKYVNAVKSSFPHCNFGVVKDSFNEGATNNIRKVHMYRDQDKYSLGWLGYMDARNAPQNTYQRLRYAHRIYKMTSTVTILLSRTDYVLPTSRKQLAMLEPT